MGLPILIFGVVALVLIGVGIGAGLFAALVASVLLFVGVISSSALLGVLTRRPATALRAFLLQCGVLAGIPAGAVTAWAANHLLKWFAEARAAMPGSFEWQIPLFGAAGGALAGLVIALSLDFVLRRTHGWLTRRVSRGAMTQP